MTPAIAPEAPTMGPTELGSARICPARGGKARDEVERQETQMAQQILHVVAEDVEKQHVPDQVHPPAMEEHGGHDRVAVLPFQGLDRDQRPSVEERHQQPLVARQVG
jgi:hypothetical protein